MRKEIITVDEKRGIIQVTTTSERWYEFPYTDKITGLVQYKFVPSVTWICEAGYVKGLAFYKWLANHGWDEAESLKIAAGDKGSKVHHAIGCLLDGKEVKMGELFLNPSTNQPEELTVEEYECILSFADWFKATKPTNITKEFCVVNKLENYAGMVDMVCTIENQRYLIDLKTSQYIWPSHELQVSAYKHALEEELKTAILQIGYRKNKRHWKLTEIEDCYDEFLAAKVIWAKETKGQKPLQREYPLSIKLDIKELENVSAGLNDSNKK